MENLLLKNKKGLVVLSVFMAFLLLPGCSATHSSQHEPMALTGWLVDWDMEEGHQEYAQLQDKLEAVVYFRAYYMGDDKLFVPMEITADREAIGKDSRKKYLSFCNDCMPPEGKRILKDTEVLKRILSDDAAIAHHAEKMVTFAQMRGFDGLELDFEEVFKHKELMPNYLKFVKQLYQKSEAASMKLRVVLQPSIDMKAGYPQGPQYVVMLYNLYGGHSGPGPKADYAFIQKVIGKMKALPGEPEIALSTGGCIWKPGKKGKFISQQEAVALMKEKQAQPDRDSKSGALSFSFEESGKTVCVWYADAETINLWLSEAAKAGVKKASIWRLGGNEQVAEIY